MGGGGVGVVEQVTEQAQVDLVQQDIMFRA